MESRDIYNRTRITIEWEKEWIHIGTDNKINKAQLSEIFKNHFQGENYLMLKRGRTNSEQIESKEILAKSLKLIGTEDFEIWITNFEKAIKVNKIGVINKSKNDI